MILGCGGTASSPPATPPPSTPPAAAANPTPSIANVNPASVIAGSAPLQVNLTGSGFVSTSLVEWNGAPLATGFTSDTELTAQIPASDLVNGISAALTIVSPAPGGGTSAPATFVVNNPSPQIVQILPSSVVAGSPAQTLDISGSGFVPSSTAAWNGTPLQTTWISASEIKAVLPAGNLSGSSADAVSVQNPAPGGGASPGTPYNVTSPAPVLATISPTVVPAGQAAVITLNGTGFESNSIVLWNGSPRPTTFVSAMVLTVSLSAADLQATGAGSISVSNPGPNSASSSGVPLKTTNQPFPAITGISISPDSSQPCGRLSITVTGKNFTSFSTVAINGTALPPIEYQGDLSSIGNELPVGLVTQPGGLSVTVSNPGQPALVSPPFVYPTTSPASLALCPTPSPATVYPGSSFSIAVQPTEVNAPGGEQVTVGTLPAGLTVAKSTVALSSTTALHFQAASTLSPGSYTVPLSGTAGASTATENLTLNVSGSPAQGFSFTSPISTELGVPIGGSASIQFGTSLFPPSLVYDVNASISGLPQGTTATVTPSVFTPGQTVTVTVTAAASAPVSQNVNVTLTGTPVAPVSASSTSFSVDVTQPPGSLPNNRTDFTSVGGDIGSAAYDSAHDLIFVANQSWNRVDVLSNKTHLLIKSIPVLYPESVDVAPDHSRVWVGTRSQRVYEIDPGRLTAIAHVLPPFQSGSWEAVQVEALSDGTLLLSITPLLGEGDVQTVIWDPSSNQLTQLNASPSQVAFWKRSGDGTRAYAISVDSAQCQYYAYSTATRSATLLGNALEVCGLLGVSQDGSRLVLVKNAAVGVYDTSLALVATLVPGDPAKYGYYNGTTVFSADSSQVYSLSGSRITTYDASSGAVLGQAPSLSTGSVFWYGTSTSPQAFAVDGTGVLLEIQPFGIGFDDATDYQQYGDAFPPAPNAVTIDPYSGPLAGGTQISPYGFFSLTPDVWFGSVRGTASLDAGNTLTVTSPPANAPGPVNLKYLFPDGTELFVPKVFSYSAAPQYSILSAGSPDGGEAGTISGWGLPTDPSNGSLSVGGNTATITTKTAQYLPFTREPFPTTFLNYTVPPGAPGFADIAVTSNAGSGTLPKAFFYAKSVHDYASSDTFNSVLYDARRSQVYLAASDHIDVFSLSSQQFTGALYPAAQGTNKQFAHMTLTPDGSQLLVTDLTDGSLAVIDPDHPSNTRAIAIAPETPGINNCGVGPLYVAAESGNRAIVAFGAIPRQSCGIGGTLYQVDLGANTASALTVGNCRIYPSTFGGSGTEELDASADGSLLNLAGCLYNPATQSGANNNSVLPGAVAVSGDSNVAGGYFVLEDPQANVVQRLAHPEAFYGSDATAYNILSVYPLLHPRLNASGSLYIWAYPNYVEFVDSLHGRLSMRFSLTETVQPTLAPLAIDGGGRYLFLITDKGLTVIDMGEAPLAIGHLSQSSAAPGTQVTVRGSGFDTSVTATVGGQPAIVSVSDENTLTLTIPASASGPEDIVLTRGDGASYTDENALTLP